MKKLFLFALLLCAVLQAGAATWTDSNGNSVEYGGSCSNVNLCVNPDVRLLTPELCPSEYGHAQVDDSRVDSIESAMQFKLIGNSLGLGDAHHVEVELFKDLVISANVGLRKHLPFDGVTTKAEEDRLLCIGNNGICKFPKRCTTRKLPKHEDQQVIPVGHGPSFCPVLAFGDKAPELPLREELGICVKTYATMYIYAPILDRMQRYTFQGLNKISFSESAVYKALNNYKRH